MAAWAAIELCFVNLRFFSSLKLLGACLPVLFSLVHSPDKVPCIMFSKPCNHTAGCNNTVPKALQSIQNLKTK